MDLDKILNEEYVDITSFERMMKPEHFTDVNCKEFWIRQYLLEKNQRIKHQNNLDDTDYDINICKHICYVCKQLLEKGDILPADVIMRTSNENEAVRSWNNKLKTMMDGFYLLSLGPNLKRDFTDDERDTINKAMNLFKKYINNLWI